MSSNHVLKTLLVVLLSLSFILGGMHSIISADVSTPIVFNESDTLPTAAQTVGGRTMVPIRYIAESLGYTVDWNSDADPIIVSLIKEGSTIILKKPVNSNLFSSTVNVNGVNKTTDVPAQLITGSTCVPVRFISETAGFIVDYYGKTSEIAVMEPSTKGKLILLTLGSKTSKIMQGTYEAGLRRMASRLTGASKDELMTLVAKVKADVSLKIATSEVATNQGLSSIYPVKYILDSNSGAQINTLSGAWGQEDFTANYGTLPLSETILGYQVEGKLYYFSEVNYKTITIATAQSTTTKNITSATDILISSVATNGKMSIQLTNTAGETYNESTAKWEAPAIVRTEAETKLVEALKPYIAAGEFMNTADFTNYVEAGKNGAIRVYSTSKPSATEKALFEKFEKTGTTKAEFSDGTNIIGIDGNIDARFNENKVSRSSKETMVSILKLQVIYDITTNKIVSFTKDTGRVVQEYNPTTNKLDYLDPFRNLYTPEQYKQKTEEMINSAVELKNNYDSRIWLKDANGLPAFCLLVGGKVGVSNDRVQYYQKSVDRLNQIDPLFVKNMRDNSGVQVIRVFDYDEPRAAAAFYRRSIGTIMFNEYDNYSGLISKEQKEWSIISLFVTESRGLENYDYSNINGAFKRNNISKWIINPSAEKEAYTLFKYEEWAGIPQNLRINLEFRDQIDLMIYFTLLDDYVKKTKGITNYDSISLGKLSVSEFMTSIGRSANSYLLYSHQ